MKTDDRLSFSETPFSEYSYFEEPLATFVEKLTKIIADMTNDELKTAKFLFESGGYETSGKIEITYTRIESDAEYESRMAEQKLAEEKAIKRAKQKKINDAKHERELYERLKRKYG